MFRRKSEEESSNFWVSYADLMAGLLFVFILLIGAIVSKSILLREDLFKKEKSLNTTQQTLRNREKSLQESLERIKMLKNDLKKREIDLENRRKKISAQKTTIEKQRQKISLQAEEVMKLHTLLSDLKRKMKEKSIEADKLKADLRLERKLLSEERTKYDKMQKKVSENEALITLKENELKLKERELEKLNQLLLARNSKIDSLKKKVVILQNLSGENNVSIVDKEKKLQKYVNKVIVLSGKLKSAESELKLKDKKLVDLLEALDKRKTDYDDLLKRLQSQKARIKSLTGIQLKVIAALKETLGDRISIDRRTGALRLSSKILFDRGSSRLKESAKRELRETFEKYIGALVSNEAIRPHLDHIIIEGHTDSDGGYMYNLRLSQKRAFAVMSYLLTLPISREYNLKKYLLASGRSYEDRIMRDGIEDKDASRRIEIKFSLKNRDAMYEIERILDEGRR